MNFHILTLFPDMVMGGLGTSITGRAMESGTISVEAIDIRDYSKDKHRHCLLYTSPSPRDYAASRMPSSA